MGHDLAFDYLSTREGDLSKLSPIELTEINGLANGAEERPLVGANIRPIYAPFNIGKTGDARVSHTRQVEDRIERALAEGLRRFPTVSKKPPRFIFCPMNAIQFGMSDNRSAYRIVRHFGSDVDVKVWQADASLDGVVALIRRLDTAITMRFYAAIFALNQDCLPIGIDYRIGKKDKVAALMEDNGQSEFFCRIDELDAHWIADRFQKRMLVKDA